MITVTENIVTSIHNSDEDCLGINEYAIVLKTCSERKLMKPVATRGITCSMGMKKPAKGMKRRENNGKKNRRIRMVMRRTTIISRQTELPIAESSCLMD